MSKNSLNIPEYVHIGVQTNFNERNQQVEYEPDIHHLDVGRFGKVVTHVDKHRC